MKISVDAGALCSTNKFGTYVTTKNILHALSLYDKNNSYTGYLYKRAGDLPVTENLKFKVLSPSLAWMSIRVSAEELIHPQDVYLGLSQAIPWLSSAKVISFLHGLSFFYHRDLYPDSYEALKDQVLFAASRSKKVIVSSLRVQKELMEEFGHSQSIVLPFGVPFDMVPKESDKAHMTAGMSLKSLRSEKPYFMFVGMGHQIKNIDFLVKAFTIFKDSQAHKDYELILVGDHKQYISDKLSIRSVSPDRKELKSLYANATGYLSSSLYESFNLPVLEALVQGCQVVGKSSAIIPEFRKYVIIADEVESFVDEMHKLCSSSTKARSQEVLEKFSWKNYVSQLIKLYST